MQISMKVSSGNRWDELQITIQDTALALNDNRYLIHTLGIRHNRIQTDRINNIWIIIKTSCFSNSFLSHLSIFTPINHTYSYSD